MLPSLRLRIPASGYRKKICPLFLSGSIVRTRHAPESPEPGLVSRSRGGLRKRITPRFLSKVLWDRVRPLKLAFGCTRRFVAPFLLSSESNISVHPDSKATQLVQ